MDRLVLERLLRFMLSLALLLEDYTFWVIFFLEILCMIWVNELKKLNGRYEVVQMVRVIVIAHIFRFTQSRFGHNKVPLVYYLRKVLLFHDLPITALISAFYTIFRTFPKPYDDVLLSLSIILQALIFVFMPKGMELERFINPSEASLNTELVPQQSYGAANYPISYTSNLSQGETEVTMDIQVTGHFVIILLAVLCVDLIVQLERLDGRYKPASLAVVLATTHASRYLQLRQGESEVPPVYYQQKTILSYDIPITAAIAGLYAICGIFSKSLVLLLCVEFVALVFLPKGERFNQTEGVELQEHDINPTQTPLNTDLVHQESHDAGFAFLEDPFNWIEDTDNSSGWVHKDRIGSGGFGAVFVAENRETKAIGAVKEIEFLRQLEHPNIVKYFDHEIFGRDIYLYMEYISPGSLRKYISKQGVLHEPVIRDFVAQILSGLVYLHSKKVVHRDIKPDNILVGPNNTIKLADFGLAKHLQHSVGNHSKLGTFPYAAPEVFRKIKYSSSLEASAADIWSLGCVIIEMFTGQIPWPGSTMKHPRIEELCPEGKDFLERCFKENPDERASAEELPRHSFVSGTK